MHRVVFEAGRHLKAAPMPRGGGNRSQVDYAVLEGLLAERPDVTTHELTAAYNHRVRASGEVHRSSIHRALHRAGYVLKKNGYVRLNKTAKPFKKSGARSSGG